MKSKEGACRSMMISMMVMELSFRHAFFILGVRENVIKPKISREPCHGFVVWNELTFKLRQHRHLPVLQLVNCGGLNWQPSHWGNIHVCKNNTNVCLAVVGSNAREVKKPMKWPLLLRAITMPMNMTNIGTTHTKINTGTDTYANNNIQFKPWARVFLAMTAVASTSYTHSQFETNIALICK